MRPEKNQMVEAVRQRVESSRSLLLANYMGLTAGQMNELRGLLKGSSSDCMVVKNRLLGRVLSDCKLPPVPEHLKGPTAIIFGSGDEASLAKNVVDFGKKYEPLRIKVGILDAAVVTSGQIQELAQLPGRDVLIAKVVGGLKAPLAGLVGVLSGVQRGLVVALNAVREKKEQEGQPQATS